MQKTFERIERCRKELGISATYLTESIGGYRGKLTDFKNGKTTLSPQELSIIAEKLHTSTDYLLGHTDDPRPPAEQAGEGQQKKTVPPEEDGPEDAETKELRAIWDTADEDERRALLEMARLIKNRRPKAPSAPEG